MGIQPKNLMFVAWHMDDIRVAVSGTDSHLRVLDVDSEVVLLEVGHGNYWVLSMVAFGPDQVATSSSNG